MSLDSSMLIDTDVSNRNNSSLQSECTEVDISACPDIEDASILNNNVKPSDLGDSLAHTEVDNSISHTTAKLSITLEPEEREQLKNSKGRQIRTNSVMRVTTDLSSCPMDTETDHTLQVNVSASHDKSLEEKRHSTPTKTKDALEPSNTPRKLSGDGEAGEESDESVIPVDEEEELDNDADTEASAMNDTKMSVKSSFSENNMFSHLQPNAKTDESISLDNESETNVSLAQTDAAITSVSYMEEDPSILLPDESDYFQYSLVELGRRVWPSSTETQSYTKGCLWSPDGTCLLVPVHLDGMHVLELPTDLYTMQELDVERELSTLTSAVHVKEGGMVYDVTWYPFMTSTDPATCCWLATRQHEPIHMWDAFTGELRCSYRGYDEVDEVESAISVAFNIDGQKVIGGYKKCIKIFDTNVPGRDYTSIKVKQTVSCMAFMADNENYVTTGSWNSFINHYDLRASKLGPLFTLGGHKGGITWLKYSAYNTDNWYLFSGARMDDKILQWDMRNYKEPVKTYERKVGTNQRIYFDLSPMNKWLISGDTEGTVRIWDMDEKHESIELPIHDDCCNGASFHPSLPILSSSSGQYHFFQKADAENSDTLNMSTDKRTINYENSVVLLWLGPQKP